ncbi:hypothetical protein V6N12_061848 [Hibiscus sabdariffa]|uniref:Uncharacterized protein n=1 Tax=Hibiscus sabdariffa TaxID=183260 RepID=A0ABR2DZW2_9ROSI
MAVLTGLQSIDPNHFVYLGPPAKNSQVVDAFLKMKRLRLLRVFCDVSNCGDLMYLSNELRLLDWKGYPLRSLPLSFHPDNLVALVLSYSQIEQLWKESMVENGEPGRVQKPAQDTRFQNGPKFGKFSLGRLYKISTSSSIDRSSYETSANHNTSSSMVKWRYHEDQLEFLEELDLSETAVTKPPSFIFQLKSLKVLSFKGQIPIGRTNSRALMLPPLSGLSSLRRLDLSDCNLCEADIPSDIFCLSSLNSLDLSGNNFISIPSSFTRFSKLEFLGLSNCRQLKSLPEVLTGIELVVVDGCASLELVANPSKVCNSMDWVRFIGNCYRLAENGNAITLLKNHLKRFTNSRKVFDVIIPGSEIPECDDADGELWCESAICSRNSEQSGCDLFEGEFVGDVDLSGYTFFSRETTEPIRKDHLFIRYWSRHKLYPSPLEGECGEDEIDDLSTSDCSEDQDWHEFVATTETFTNVQVKKCGIRIVFQKDLEDIAAD